MQRSPIHTGQHTLQWCIKRFVAVFPQSIQQNDDVKQAMLQIAYD
ncbi:MAG: hypothetical protein ACTHMM_02965 [Agriterribacter sp.]